MPNKSKKQYQRQEKKLDRIERRLNKGMRSVRQAERNLDRTEKISNKRIQAGNYPDRAASVGDHAYDVYLNMNEANKYAGTEGGPFYKTGEINYNKK